MVLELVLQNILANAITTEIDTGAGTAELIFETVADAEVALISLQNPSFGAAVVGVITLLGVRLSEADAAGGETVQASIFDRDGTKQLEMTVGTSGTDIIISSTTIAALDVVDLNSLTITVPTGP